MLRALLDYVQQGAFLRKGGFFQKLCVEFCSFAILTVIVAKGEINHRPCRKGVRM